MQEEEDHRNTSMFMKVLIMYRTIYLTEKCVCIDYFKKALLYDASNEVINGSQETITTPISFSIDHLLSDHFMQCEK